MCLTHVYYTLQQKSSLERKENYFLTKEQIEEAFGDNNLKYVQLEDVYYHLICNEFRYRNIAFITVCDDPVRIYDFMSSHSQIKIQIGIPTV